MKKKIVLGVAVFLLVLQAQTVFAADYDGDFVKELNRNNIGNIEKLLEKRAKQMNLAFCMNAAIKPSNWEGTENYNKSNCLDVIKLLVRYGADVNSQHIIYNYNPPLEFGRPLQIAIEQKQPNISVIKFLLDSGARTDFKAVRWNDENGSPIPFIEMAYIYALNNNNGNMEIVNLLLDHGAKGELILPILAARGENDFIKRLITRGVQIRSNEGAEALRKSVEFGKFDTVKLLIENNVNVNARDNNGNTALSFAYDKGEMDIYDYLKAHGARDFEPRQVTQQQTTPSQSSSTTNVYVQPSTSSPSNSSSSSEQSRNVGKEIADAFKSPLQSGTYSLAGTQEKISIAAIAKSGIISQTWQGKTYQGTYNIDGNRMTVQIRGYTFVFNITSETSFSGHGETWVRTGY